MLFFGAGSLQQDFRAAFIAALALWLLVKSHINKTHLSSKVSSVTADRLVKWQYFAAYKLYLGKTLPL